MAKLYIYGTIGFDVEADYIRAALDDMEGEVELRINSGGGDVFEGNAIYSLLESYKTKDGNSVTVYVDGIAASIASVIAMAGDTIHMSKNALMMIHNPWTPAAAGGSDDLRNLATVLDKIRETIVTVYESKTGMDRETLLAMMEDETWFSAAEAVNFGFADVVIDLSEEPAASIKAFNYVNAPNWLNDINTEIEVEPILPIRRKLAKAKLAINRCCNKINNN
tara:strand:+ start:626 stop:1291 length:666 start_codon:yes stop_codon:yes gene_type:complete